MKSYQPWYPDLRPARCAGSRDGIVGEVGAAVKGLALRATRWSGDLRSRPAARRLGNSWLLRGVTGIGWALGPRGA